MKGKPLFILISLLAIFLTAAAAFAGDETAPSDEYEVPEPVYGVDYEIGDAAGNGKIAVHLYANSEYDGYKVCGYDDLDELKDTQFAAADEDNSIILNVPGNYTIYVEIRGFKEFEGTKYYSEWTNKIIFSRNLFQVPSYPELTIKSSGSDSVIVTWQRLNYSQKQIEVLYSDALAGDYSIGCSGIGQCSVTGLSLNKVYYFRVHWLGEIYSYHNGYEETINVYGPLSEAEPFILRAEQEEGAPLIGNKKIRVYFEDDEALTGHQIKTYDTGTGKLVKTVNVKRTKNPTYADITGLKNGTEYRFDICSYTVNGKKTEYGEISSVTATPQLKPVDGDVDITAGAGLNVNRKKVTIAWSCPYYPPEEPWSPGYYAELRRVDNGVLVMKGYAVRSNAVRRDYTDFSPAYYTFFNAPIEKDVLYMSRVWKYNEKTPTAVGNDYVESYSIFLTEPTAFNVLSNDGSVNVSWKYNGVADQVNIRYYLLERDAKTSNNNSIFGCAVTKAENSCTVSGLDNGTVYYFKAVASYEYEGKKESATSVIVAAMPLPVMNSATVTPGSKSLTVQYDKVDGVDGHMIQLYRMSGTKAKLVKTVTSTDKNDTVTVSFKGLSNNTTYRVCISAYKKYEKKVYRSAVATYDDIIPSANASAGKDLIGVSDLGESFDGFVDPLGELDSQTDTAF